MANAKTGKTPANVSVNNAVHSNFFALCCAGYRLACCIYPVLLLF